MRLGAFWVVVCAVGCGGGASERGGPENARTSERDRRIAAFAREREALDAEQPESPYVDERARVVAAPGACGQGPYRIRFQAVGAPHGERVRVYACTSRSIKGTYRLRQGERDGEPRTFGHGQDNGRCTVQQGARTAAGGAGGGGTDVAGGGAGSTGSAATAAPSAEPLDLVDAPADSATECGPGRYREPILDHTFIMQGPAPALQPGLAMQVLLWSELPNDLAGVTFVVDQDVVRRDMSTEAWLAYLRARDTYHERLRALLDREVAAGVATLVDSTPRVAEPPPPPRTEERPPRPSENAEWVPGYWHFETRWSWIGGWWRVPEGDVQADLVVRAPVPPPPPRVEQPVADAKPARDAIWTAGAWQWDGRAYVWVSGAWRIPPTLRHRWQPAGWRARGSVSIFVPGGWILGR